MTDEKLEQAQLRIDLGCGPNPKEGFVGVDKIDFQKPGQIVLDIGCARWPWDDSSVDEAYSAHFIEHLTNFNDKWERVHFFNELYRVLKPSAQCLLIFPHWCANRYYGDPTHKEPFGEMGFYYLDPNWRKVNAPHTDSAHNEHGYSCYFNCTWHFLMHNDLVVKSQEVQQFAINNYKEAVQDVIATLTANKNSEVTLQ